MCPDDILIIVVLISPNGLGIIKKVSLFLCRTSYTYKTDRKSANSAAVGRLKIHLATRSEPAGRSKRPLRPRTVRDQKFSRISVVISLVETQKSKTISRAHGFYTSPFAPPLRHTSIPTTDCYWFTRFGYRTRARRRRRRRVFFLFVRVQTRKRVHAFIYVQQTELSLYFEFRSQRRGIRRRRRVYACSA